MTDVAVIDYGVGNLLSVRRAFEHCGATVTVTADPKAILSAPRVVLPGVGAFASAMTALRGAKLDEVVLDVERRGSPLLGICLGMQMLMDLSEEFGVTSGLGVIGGRVVAIPSTDGAGHVQKIPHIGWNGLRPPEKGSGWSNALLRDAEPGDSVYFVHSFMAVPDDPFHRLADCVYGERRIAAIVGRDNVMGCQFHPEKSGEAGLRILRRFLAL